jgi:hydrogenase maturation protease
VSAPAPRARIVGLGQRAAGDDGVGLAVLARLRAAGAPEGVELVEAAEASALVDAVRLGGPVVVVDAVLADPPGVVLTLSEDDLSRAALSPLSSHGLSAGGALALARSLDSGAVSRRITIVAVSIAAPGRYRLGLSPEVAAAVDPAARAALDAVR